MSDPNVTSQPGMNSYLCMHMDEALVRFGASLFSTGIVLQAWV